MIAEIYFTVIVCAMFYVLFLVLGNKPIGMLIIIMGVVLCTKTVIKDRGPEIREYAHPKKVQHETVPEWLVRQLLDQLKKGDLK